VDSFLTELRTQRWDDHRYYHHCRINQSLHLVSALSFLTAYVVLVFDPATAALIAWLVSMTTRQAGHFFFEPRGYDAVNQATHEYKEAIKVGYNLRRKAVLMSAWAAVPAVLWADPTFFGLLPHPSGPAESLHAVGMLWLGVGSGALVLRMAQLYVTRGIRTGTVWAVKILTDPFHDVALYWQAPLYLLRGERLDSMGR
jgi:hypothetical protein